MRPSDRLMAPTARGGSIYPELMYAKSLMREAPRKQRNAPVSAVFDGFFSDIGRHAAFDEACQAAVDANTSGISRNTLYHTRTGTEGGEPETVDHWLFDRITAFILATRFQHIMRLDTKTDMAAIAAGSPPERYGIAMGWYPGYNTQVSFMRVPILMREPLNCMTYGGAVILNMNGTITSPFCDDLGRHLTDVLDPTWDAAEAAAAAKNGVNGYTGELYSSAVVIQPAAELMKAGTKLSQDVTRPELVLPDGEDTLTKRIARKKELDIIQPLVGEMHEWSRLLTVSIIQRKTG